MISTTAMEPHIPRPTTASRLHLYLAWGCPFCHRVVAALAITRLSGSVGITWMRNIKGPAGWQIAPGNDPLFGETSLMRVYQRLEPGVRHASVPLLVDVSSKALLSSSSSQITRFFARGMNGVFPVARELVPAHLIEQIDSTNAWLHEQINRAVYQVGFATAQADYEAKVARLFQSLDTLETRLATQPYLLGDALTESDLYLLATLVRFDSVYYPLFKCSVRRIADYPALSGYLARLQSIEGIPDTYNHKLIKQHYFCSVMHIAGEIRDFNPSRIIPVDADPGRQSRRATAHRCSVGSPGTLADLTPTNRKQNMERHESMNRKKICIVGASGKLGQYMVRHALDRGYQVVGVCRAQSVDKLDAFDGRMTVIPGATNDREVIKHAVAGCGGVLTVLVPWGVQHYSTGTAQAVLDFADPGARLIFSCGWHISKDGRDVYSRTFRTFVKVFGWVARLTHVADLNDQVEACRRIFSSDTRWTVVRGSDLEEGESQGLPVWSRHVGDPLLKSNLTRRIDFALFMVQALENDGLIHEAPAIVGCQTPSALAAAVRQSQES